MPVEDTSEEFNPDNRGQVILYRANGVNVPVEVTYWQRTFWMPQKNIAQLFGVTPQTVTRHIQNIYSEGELDENATCTFLVQVRNEGGRTVRRTIRFYNLNAIIAVGYRVNSPQATAFRQWATSVLHEYMIKGFALNDDMLKNGNTFGEDYFKELLTRVREIRTSEKRLYQQVLAIFQEICTDYDKDSNIAREFYQNMQNRFHYAAHGHTAPEIISQRVDATKPHMGLTTWQGSPNGRIHKSDVTVAKNYLDENELTRLNRLTSGFLDMIENRVAARLTTTMPEFIQFVSQYIQLSGGATLTGKSTVTRKQADKKAFEEYAKFNATQLYDFEKFAKGIDGGHHDGIGR